MQNYISRVFSLKTSAIVLGVLAITLFGIIAPRVVNKTKAEDCADINQIPVNATFNPFNVTWSGTGGYDCTDHPTLSVKRAGTFGGYAPSIQAQNNDELVVSSYIHNGARQDLGSVNTAHNVQVHFNVDTSEGTNHNVSVTITGTRSDGSPIPSKSGNISIQTPAGSRLEVVPGSGEIQDHNSNYQNSASVGGSSFTVNLGDVRACFEFSHFVNFTVKVVGPAAQPQPQAHISANLGSQVSGQCLFTGTVTWTTENVDNVRVYVRDPNNGNETLMAAEESATKNIDWLEPDRSYNFILRGNGIADQTAVINTGSLNCGGQPQQQASIFAQLGGQVAGQCLFNGTVTWSTENVNNVRVYVRDPNTGSESLMAAEESATKHPDWLEPNRTYVFTLRGDGIADKTASITTGNLNCGTTPPANKTASIQAHLGGKVAGVCLAKGTVTWSTENVDNVRVYGKDLSTGVEQLMAAQEDGTRDIDWMNQSRTYRFTLRGDGIADRTADIVVGDLNCGTAPSPLVCVPNNSTLDINQAQTFTATGGDLSQGAYTWFVDGTFVAGNVGSINRSFSTSGSHSVLVKIGALQTASCNVTVRTPITHPPLVCTVETPVINVNQAATIRASGGNGVYSWSSGGNPNTGSGSVYNPKFSSSATGNQTIYLTSGDGQQRTCNVFVNPPVQPQTLICTTLTPSITSGGTATFVASGGNAPYNWTGGQATGSGQNYSSVFTNTGSVAVNRVVQVSSSDGQVASCNVVVNPVANVCVINTNVSLTNSGITQIGNTGVYSTTIFYSFSGSNAMRITYINPDTNQEVTFVASTTSSGSKVFDQILPNKNYVFKIYDLSSCGGIVTTLIVRKDITQCVSNTSASLVASAPVLSGSLYSVGLTWSSSGSHQIKITQDGSSNVITTGGATGSVTVNNLAPGSSHTFSMFDVDCGTLLGSISITLPQPQQQTGGSCIGISCNNNTINNNVTGNNNNNVGNNTNINGNNNTVTNVNTCVNNSCNNTYYINQQGTTVPANEFRQLAIEKLVRNVNGGSFQNNVTVNNNDTVEFQITVRNTGSQPVNNVVVNDTWTGNLDYISNSTRVDGSYTNHTFYNYSSISLGTMFSGQQKTITFQARANGNNGSNVQNIARASGDSVSQVQDDAWVFITGGVAGGNVNLTFSKRANNDTKNVDATSVNASRSDFITYTLTVSNNGNFQATNFVITDDLSQVLPYADMVDNGGGSLNGNVITYPGLTIPAGGSVSKNFRVRIKSVLADNLSYVLTNTYGNTITIRVNTPQVQGSFIAPKTGADTAAFTFATMLTAAFAVARKRKELMNLIFS